MRFLSKTPTLSLNAAFKKQKPLRNEFDTFKAELITLLDSIDGKESEEFHKNLAIRFLTNAFYKDNNFINTKEKKDLVIHTGKDNKTPVGVIIEFKSPKGNESEMFSLLKPQSKSLIQLILYYFEERCKANNTEIKHLVITNIYEWFLFDANEFDKHIYRNTKIKKLYDTFESDSKDKPFFYEELKKLIPEIEEELTCTHFDIRTYEKNIRNVDKEDDNQLRFLYKVLSPFHLLKIPFANDSNSLDKIFYDELLHIIGLGETKDGGKKIIQRLPEGSRNAGSLLENTITQLDSHDKLSRLPQPSQYGATHQERLFTVALELVITWMNRVLFLKLLEAQLLTYHKGNKAYSFLSKEKISDYDELDKLFFRVLAKKVDERDPKINELFGLVPYLNSSLFEPTDIEHQTLFINGLENDIKLSLHKNTVLKDEKGKRRTDAQESILYLFEYLNAYDFSSDSSGEIQEDNKTLINASVLGLIFEKINGYKDGSFFTPGFITMYMCRETIRRAVVQKFNEHCLNHDLPDFKINKIEEVYDLIPSKISRTEANAVVNSLKICDPAVGSGHFLVSALNEIIAIKNDLKILEDRQGKSLHRYEVTVENDELAVTDEDGQPFEYQPNNKESQRVQEALFHEKQTIIENCLFGVDINPNSVKICRLRLWVELLKNAYYRQGVVDVVVETHGRASLQQRQLETLPNIDINIKCGNSLISRFGLDEDLKQALKKSKWNIDSYKLAVQTYRHAQSKEEKREMERLISDIKSDFRTEINKNDKNLKKLQDRSGELYNLLNQSALFEPSKAELKTRKQKQETLEKEIEALTNYVEEIKSNKIYENAFEWRFEFPEVLDNEGAFVGFDVVIGNPPYIRQEEISEIKPYLQQKYKSFTGTADLFVYFIELGLRNLKEKGNFTYIVPNKWMKAGYGKQIRGIIKSNNIEQIIDFGDLPVFEEATTYPSILSLSKEASSTYFEATNVTTLNFHSDLAGYFQENKIQVVVDELSNESWTLSDTVVQQIISNLKKSSISLGEFVNHKMYRGILTGFNEAFIIDENTKEELIAKDPKSSELIMPFLDGKDIKSYLTPKPAKWLIVFKNGLTKEWFGKIEEDVASIKLDEKCSSIKSWFDKYEAHLKKRTDKGEFWWELRPCVYYSEFEKDKIVWAETSLGNQFCMVEGGVYLNKTTFMIPSNDFTLLAILNSRFVEFYLDSIVSKVRGGYFSMSKSYVETIPIVYPKETLPFVEKAKKIIEVKKTNPTADTTALEKEIDALVYELYGLSEEEIKIVEGV